MTLSHRISEAWFCISLGFKNAWHELVRKPDFRDLTPLEQALAARRAILDGPGSWGRIEDLSVDGKIPDQT